MLLSQRPMSSERRPKELLLSDFVACDGHVLQSAWASSKKKHRMSMIVWFIMIFLGTIGLFSSYESIRNEGDFSREKRLGQSSTMVVSISHVDYGVLGVKAESILLPPEPDLSILNELETCCGISASQGTTANHTHGQPTTTQLRVSFSQPFWHIQALDQNGKEIKTGGDEYFVTLSTPSFSTPLVARVVDQDNGSYDLDFFEPPLSHTRNERTRKETGSNITLTVELINTCGRGQVGSLEKQNWKTNGAIVRSYHFDDAFDQNAAGKRIRLPEPSFIRQPWPLLDKLTNIDTEKWTVKDMPERRRLVFFGDANMRAMGLSAQALSEAGDKSRVVAVADSAVEVLWQNINNTQQELDKFLRPILETLDNSTISLWLGFNSYDVTERSEYGWMNRSKLDESTQSMPFSWEISDHLRACELLVENVRERFPNVHLVWRLPIPFPVHQYPSHRRDAPMQKESFCTNQPFRNLSYFGMRQIYQAERQLMLDLNVPVLDFFDSYFVSPDQYIWEKGVYTAQLHQKLLTALYNLKRDDLA